MMNHPITYLPIVLVDYIWVILAYVTVAFWLAVLIDGYILPRYDQAETDRTSSLVLFIQVIIQVALQGFIAMGLSYVLRLIPSLVHGLFGYNSNGPQGQIVRNPAIISVLLFALSISLQGRLKTLFGRSNRNARKQ